MMKFIDQKGKIFKFINIIDLGIIIMVLLIGLTVGYKFLSDRANAKPVEVKDVTFVVKFRSVIDTPYKALRTGDKVMSLSTVVENTTVEDIKIAPIDFVTTTDDGELLLKKHPTLNDVFVTVKAKMNTATPTLKLGVQEVAVGKVYTLKTQTFESQGNVDSIQIEEAN